MALVFKASRSACAIVFASRKSRMRAPLHRRTEEIGACLADPFANGEGGEETDTFTIPKGRRRRVYRPCANSCPRPGRLSIRFDNAPIPDRGPLPPSLRGRVRERATHVSGRVEARLQNDSERLK